MPKPIASYEPVEIRTAKELVSSLLLGGVLDRQPLTANIQELAEDRLFADNEHLYDLAVLLISLKSGGVRVSVSGANNNVVVGKGNTIGSMNTGAGAIQGDHNVLTDSSINIGQSFNEKHERISALADLLGRLKAAEEKNDETAKAENALIKVKSELTDEAEPNTSAIKKWMETAKNSLGTAALGYEIVEAGKKVWELFGL